MKSIFLICLVGLSLVVMATAVVEIPESAKAYYLERHIKKNSGQCYKYGESCDGNYPCCQYLFRDQLGCVSGQCLQEQCSSSGQDCGSLVGECCYHQGLACDPNESNLPVCDSVPPSPIDEDES